MAKVVSCFLGIVFLLFCGCTSYRLKGSVVHASNTIPSTEKKYRIEKFINKSDVGIYASGYDTDPWSIPAVSKRFSETEMCSDLMSKNPKVFSCAADSIPLEVEIYSRSESKDGRWSIIFPYILTLGIFPAWIGTTSQSELKVTSLADRNIRTSCIIDFRSDIKLTVFSPIGLIAYDATPEATSYRTGSGLMTAPHVDAGTLWELRTVYTETLAVAICRCAQELEKQMPTAASMPSNDHEKAPPPAAEPTPPLKEKLQQLKELKDAGVLTDREYDAKRKLLIDQL